MERGSPRRARLLDTRPPPPRTRRLPRHQHRRIRRRPILRSHLRPSRHHPRPTRRPPRTHRHPPRTRPPPRTQQLRMAQPPRSPHPPLRKPNLPSLRSRPRTPRRRQPPPLPFHGHVWRSVPDPATNQPHPQEIFLTALGGFPTNLPDTIIDGWAEHATHQIASIPPTAHNEWHLDNRDLANRLRQHFHDHNIPTRVYSHSQTTT